MNAREIALEQARKHWAARGIIVEPETLLAHQAPLAGSVWWVEGHARGDRYDVLVRRLEKQAFQFLAHCPWGYTLYACYQGGETAIAVVEYEEQARERVRILDQSRSHAHATLIYLANPSAAWRDGIQAQLEMKASRQAEDQRQRMASRRATRSAVHIIRGETPRVFPLTAPSHNECIGGTRQALQDSVFALVARAMNEAGVACSRTTERNLRRLITRRVQQENCLPFGCMWTPVRCLLALPADAGSRNEVGNWIGWREQSYCLWFDGSCVRECSYQELREILARSCS